MGAMMAMPSFAQGEDVTHLIKNAGFDEDLTFQADGSTKEIIDKTKVLSDRSYGYMAADSSIYAFGRGSRSDGRTPAWNGFFGQISGWTKGDKSYTGKLYYPYGSDSPEWVYFGTLSYDMEATTLPCADDGTTFFTVPKRPAVRDGLGRPVPVDPADEHRAAAGHDAEP